MTPEDIRRIVVVEELDLSTDGRLAVVVRRSIKGDRYHGHLFAIDLDRPRRPAAPAAHPGRRAGHRAAPLLRRANRRLRPHDPDRRGHTSHDRVARSGAAWSSRPLRQDRGSRGRRRGGMVTGWAPPGVHRRGGPASIHRRPGYARQPPAPTQREDRRDTLATGPAHHPGRLALGRRGSSRPLDAPVRRRLGRRTTASGDEWRLGRLGHRLASRR